VNFVLLLPYFPFFLKGPQRNKQTDPVQVLLHSLFLRSDKSVCFFVCSRFAMVAEQIWYGMAQVRCFKMQRREKIVNGRCGGLVSFIFSAHFFFSFYYALHILIFRISSSDNFVSRSIFLLSVRSWRCFLLFLVAPKIRKSTWLFKS